ncbi:fibronectin type III domain-containing protein, partial [Hungatella hathewayi]
VPESVTDPAEGEVLYVTANSASGSKYYSIHNKDFPYAAVMNQESTPNITNVEVTDKSFAITTYRTTDMSVVDTFAIYKDGYQPPQAVIKSVSLGVGADESETMVTWYSDSKLPGKVQLVKKSDLADRVFPETAAEFAAEKESANEEGFFTNQAVIRGLESGAEYAYRVGDGTTWSDVYDLTVQDSQNGFNFLLAGDPQIGAGSTDTDIKGWQRTMETAIKAFPRTSFLISAGDQVNTASNEAQYAGY